VTLIFEENVSCKNLISFETKLLHMQRLVSDAQRNVRLYSTIKDRQSPLKGSRPSVPHGTNFFHIFFYSIISICGYGHCELPWGSNCMWVYANWHL